MTRDPSLSSWPRRRPSKTAGHKTTASSEVSTLNTRSFQWLPGWPPARPCRTLPTPNSPLPTALAHTTARTEPNLTKSREKNEGWSSAASARVVPQWVESTYGAAPVTDVVLPAEPAWGREFHELDRSSRLSRTACPLRSTSVSVSTFKTPSGKRPSETNTPTIIAVPDGGDKYPPEGR